MLTVSIAPEITSHLFGRFYVGAGWWDEGRFIVPVMERTEFGPDHATGWRYNLTGCSNEARARCAATLRHAARHGLQAARVADARLFHNTFPIAEECR